MHVYIKKLLYEMDPSDCALPTEVFENLGLKLGVIYTIFFGGISYKAFVVNCKSRERCIYFSKKLLKKLLLPTDTALNICRRGENIYLGPVVGIFVNTRFLGRFETGCPYKIAIENMKASHEAKCFCYYFSIDNIDWAAKRVKGYRLIPSSGEWEHSWFPVPNVIYDRGVNFTEKQNCQVEGLWQLLKEEPHIHLINNRHHLEKWDIHRLLIKHHEIRKYLPETILYEGFDSVLKMLEKYDFIFVKSSLGSKGKEVFSIDKAENKYRLVFNYKGLKEIEVADIKDVREYVMKFTKGKLFIVQQGIRLMKYKGRNMDLRILIIKDESGQWEAVKYYSRFAQGNLTITNSSTGGDIENYEKIYENLKITNDKTNIPGLQELKKISVELAAYIESDCGEMGEIGIDMAIDEEGRVWFLEANGKPDKALIEGVDDINEVSPKALAIFKYAIYLASKNCDDSNEKPKIDSRRSRQPAYYLPGQNRN